MTPEQFTYWLQGFAELTTTTQPSEQQWAMIQEHLQLVFRKETKLVVTDQLVVPNDTFNPIEITPDFPPVEPMDYIKPPNTITC